MSPALIRFCSRSVFASIETAARAKPFSSYGRTPEPLGDVGHVLFTIGVGGECPRPRLPDGQIDLACLYARAGGSA